MTRIFTFLRDSFSTSAEFTKINLFIDALEKGQSIDLQLAGCIAIDIKYGLIDTFEYEKIILEFVNNFTLYNILDFHGFIQNRYTKKNCFSNICKPNPNIENIRILREAIFDKFYSSTYKYKSSTPKKYKIEGSLIRKYGWSGGKDIVWITPFDEFEALLSSFVTDGERANAALDYVGFPRDQNIIMTGSPLTGGIDTYLYIKYPRSFNDICYQPNATNADWSNIKVLYVSYNKAYNGYGKTYNTNGQIFAKEQIHGKSFFWEDKAFEAHRIGQPSISSTDKSNIFAEILKRF
jgi:hypothetical protein